MIYKVVVHNNVVKEYPTELQAIIYCLMNGYINTGYGWYFLDDRVKIERCEQNEFRESELG